MKSLMSVALPFSSCLLPSTAFHPIAHRTGPLRTRLSVHPVHTQVELDESAYNSRRAFFSAAATVGLTIATPAASNAVYGADAKMELPDIAQGMADRNSKQCLVESLGNRECLVYLDPENQLYKGSDSNILFERLGSSIAALKGVPQYIENKQWNKVQGVITGPMGTLSSTMNELVKSVENGSIQNKCKGLSSDIRKDLYAIAAAAERKQVKEALISCEKAEEKLEKFVILLSSV